MKISHKIILPMTIALGTLGACYNNGIPHKFVVVNRGNNKVQIETLDKERESYIMEFDTIAPSRQIYNVIGIGDTLYVVTSDLKPHTYVFPNTFYDYNYGEQHQRVKTINGADAGLLARKRAVIAMRDSIITEIINGKIK